MTAADEIAFAKNLLAQGEVIGLPTETVYGLAARIDLPEAVEKIFTTKERPFFDPLIVHVASIDQAKSVTTLWGPIAQALAEAFWPGPLTMVLPKADSVNSMITSGLGTVGIRMPNHPLALDLLKEVGVPLAAPSANKFGRTSPTSASHVRLEFHKEKVFVVDGGDCQIGIESTVLLVKEQDSKAKLSILRRGHVLQSDIESALKAKGLNFEFVEVQDKKESPGHMKHHYMPSVPLILSKDLARTAQSLMTEANQKLAEMPDEIESIRITKPKQGLHSNAIMTLSDDPVLASRELYAKLREVAELGKDCIIYYRKADQYTERWESLFDRLNKAASLIVD
jgi:L-threonylcarbamoyladenylate synthase